MAKFDLLFEVLTNLDQAGLLDKLVLVGSWCQDFYRAQYGQPASIPAARTMDVDILVPRDIKVGKRINVAKLLEKSGFVESIDYQTGLQRFTHPELDIEFLTTAKAGPRESILRFDELGLTAQELRFMSIPLQHHYQVTHQGLTITIPEPEAFALHKLIVSMRRTSPAKAAKDRATAAGLFAFFEKHPAHITRLWEIYAAMPKGWRKRIQDALEKAGITLPELPPP